MTGILPVLPALALSLAALPATAQETPPVNKTLALPADQIRPLVDNRAGAIASDRITVEGRKVGYMYREAADRPEDSGWRFLAGDEDDAYMDDARNHGVHAVNTIANYDPEIIRFLDAPIGSAFIRIDGKLVPDSQGAPEPRD